MEVFAPNHAFPFSKMLTFYRKEPFDLEASYSKNTQLPLKDGFIGKCCWQKIFNGVFQLWCSSENFLGHKGYSGLKQNSSTWGIFSVWGFFWETKDPKEGNDHLLKKLLIVKQILIVCTIRNV